MIAGVAVDAAVAAAAVCTVDVREEAAAVSAEHRMLTPRLSFPVPVPHRGSHDRNDVHRISYTRRCLASVCLAVSAEEIKVKLLPSSTRSLHNSAYLAERIALSANDLIHGIGWNANQGRGGNGPSKPVGPARIVILSIVIRWRFVVDQAKYPQ